MSETTSVNPTKKKIEPSAVGGGAGSKPEAAKEDVGQKEKSVSAEPTLAEVMGAVTSLATSVQSIAKKVHDIETGGKDRFKEGVKAEDVAFAGSTRAGLDPKISKIVDEMLGEDFGAELKPLGDRPGFRFTVIVPTRLSDNVQDKRPSYELNENGEKTGNYVKDKAGNVVFEDYTPEDRRSRIVSNGESYDVIKSHCEKVRGYIVTYFTNKSQPVPEFKVR